MKDNNKMKDLVKYFIVGGLASIGDMLIFILAIKIMNYHLALWVSFSIGLLINCLGCNLFIFRKQSWLKVYSKQYLMGLFSLLLSQLLLSILVNTLGYIIISRLIIMAIMFLVNFSINKYLVYGSK